MSSWIRTHKQTIIKVLGSLLALGALFSLFEQQSWDEVLDATLKITWLRFLSAAGLLMLSRLFTVARWHTLLRSGGVDISIKQTTSITFTGLFASNFLPTTIGGDIVRVGGLIQLGYSRAVCTASIVVDRLIGMFGMAMLLPFGALSLGQWYSETPTLLSATLPFAKRRKWFTHIIKRLFESLQLWLKEPLGLFFALLFTWGHMICLFSSLLIIASGLGESVTFWELATIWSLAYFVTLLPISINGYGMQELSLTYLLSNIGGVTLANSLVIAILIRVLFIIASLPGAIFLPTLLTTMKKKENMP